MKTIAKLLFFIFLILTSTPELLAQTLREPDQIKGIDSVEIGKASVKPERAHLWHVCPNPFQEKLTVIFSEEPCDAKEFAVKIYDLFSGKCVFEGKFRNKLEIETSDWQEGLFAVYISDDQIGKSLKAFHKSQ